MHNAAPFQVYHASAGSGKTFTLVKEYLKILLSNDDPLRFQQILAVTFTNKAASEMKDRVLNTLNDISKGQCHALCGQISDELKTGDMIIFCATLLWACSGVYTKKIIQNYHPFQNLIVKYIA